MAYECRIILDSMGPSGIRLTTMQVKFPRFTLAEFNTHRALSRNFQSSRAIPVEKRIQQVETDPFVPDVFGRNRRGMQAGEVLDYTRSVNAKDVWYQARNNALESAGVLARLGVHKQLANRLLEPFAWVEGVVTATDWDNFFHLRCHPDAQPEFQHIATMMRDALAASEPAEVSTGGWHLPYVLEDDFKHPRYGHDRDSLLMIASARCARVSYCAFDGTTDLDKDVRLGAKLLSDGHMSPFEHAAQALRSANRVGNFRGWKQWRKFIPMEHDRLAPVQITD